MGARSSAPASTGDGESHTHDKRPRGAKNKTSHTVSLDIFQHNLNAAGSEAQSVSSLEIHRSSDIPLQGGIATLGEYYANVYIDNQRLRLQIDTGSSSLLVVGEGCANCTSRSLLKWNRKDAVPCDGKACFQCFPGTSDCGFRLKYGDDTPQYSLEATGVVVSTKAKLRKDWLDTDDVLVYVIQKETGPWPKKVDGILGMAYPKLNCNPTCFQPAWQTLAPGGSIGFKVCFGDKGGLLSFYEKSEFDLGGFAKLKLGVSGNPKLYYAVFSRGLGIQDPRENDRNKFMLFSTPQQEHQVGLRNVAIMDTGTTLLILPNQMWINFVKFMQSKYCHLDGVCEHPSIFDRPMPNQAICLTEPPYDTFPTLALSIGEGALKLPPSLYFIKYERNIYCLGIQPGPVLIVGDTVLRGFSTYYDSSSVTITSQRAPECGVVSSLTDEDLIVGKAHFTVARHDVSNVSYLHRALSFAILLVVLVLLINIWRRYMRRRLGYVEI